MRLEKKYNLKLSTALIGIIGTFAIPPSVQAEANTNSFLEEIVITARKKEENLQTTPIAVTALTADALEKRQIIDIGSIQYSAPNVNIQPLIGNSGVGMSIRGQVGVENTAASDSPVGVYVDGVYTARSSMGFLELVDIERIEVLRGPQGTLFGRNTTGGALNITTPAPAGEFSGRLTGRYGNYDTKEILGHVNIPLQGEDVALRVSFKHAEHDGYGKSLSTDREFNNLNSDFIRIVGRVAPEDAIYDITVSADYYNRKGNGPLAAVHAVRPGSTADAFGFANYIPTDFYTNYSTSDTFEDITAKGASLTANFEIGELQLKSITALRDLQNNIFTDADGTPFPVIEFTQHNDQKSQFTQELQLSGEGDTVSWITGAFYFTEENDDLTESTTAVTAGQIDNKSFAIFGQATYAISDRWRATGGLRYTWDKRSIGLSIFNAAGTTCTLPTTDTPGECLSNASSNFHYLSYLANVDYQFSDSIFVYAKTSRASRAGGYNNRVITAPFNPEKVTDYEVGFKADLLNNRLRANIALFLTKYDNVQRTIVTVVNGAPTALTNNAAKAEIPGLEIELTAIPFENLEIGGSLGLLDPKYNSFDDPLLGDRSDEPFTYTSTTNFSVYATYTVPLSFGELTMHADYGYKSKIYYNTSTPELDVQDGYGILNARIALRLDDPNIELSVYGRNLTKTEYNTYILDVFGPFGYNAAYRGTPRTYGAELTFRF